MFDPFFDLIATLLAWFYSLWPSYGMAIGILTLALMVVATPFTLKGIRSMLQMQEFSSDLKRIQNEHRGDRQATNEATMAFYKEHGVNPMGSCLPMLIQAPVFLVLYQVVRGLTRRTTEIGTQLGLTARQHAEAARGDGASGAGYAETLIRKSELTFDPDFLSRDTDLYASLSDSTEMVSWGIDLSRTASAALAEGVVEALPYFIMLVLVFVTGLYQQHQIQRRQKGAVVNKQQQMIMKLLPYFLPVFSYSLPAAVVVYFIVSAVYRILQQAYITKSYYTGEDSLGARAVKQRAAGATEGGTKTAAKETKSTTEGKGAATRKRDARASRPKEPVRKQRASRSGATGSATGTPRRSRTGKAPSRRSRTGKAPSRRRSGSSRTRPGSGSGRTTPPGSRASRGTQNRSRSKRKRR